jgi:hypothetical protein
MPNNKHEESQGVAIMAETIYSIASSTEASQVIAIMLSETAYSSKPVGRDAYITLNGELSRNKAYVSPKELCEKICTGRAWVPGVLEGGSRTSDSWVQQQAFALDFDNKNDEGKALSMEQFMTRCKTLDILPAFVHSTYSHTLDVPRFRAVFICDQLITDKRVRKFAQLVLMELFSFDGHCPDNACKDPSRMFLGTIAKPYYENYDVRFNPIGLFDRLVKDVKKNDSPHFAAHMKKLADKLGVTCEGSNIGVNHNMYIPEPSHDSGEFIVGVINTIAQTPNSPTDGSTVSDSLSVVRYSDSMYTIQWKVSHYQSTPKSELRGRGQERTSDKATRRLTKDDKKALLERCQMVKDFFSGDRHLSHHERRLILTNLCQRIGGRQWYVEGLKLRTDYASDTLLHDVVYYKMKPEGCSACPYKVECEHKSNLLQQIQARRRECRIIRPASQGVSLEDTRVYLRDIIGECLQASDGRVHVVRCDTGVGKTHVLLEKLLGDTCVAFPTHELKDEAYKRYVATHDNEPFLWPKRPILPEQHENDIRQAQALGLGGTRTVMQQALKDKEVLRSERWYKSIQDYVDAMSDIHSSNFVFATHEKALQLSHLPRYVYDEDPLPSIGKVLEVSVADIERLRTCIRKMPHCTKVEAIESHLKTILQMPQGIPQRLGTPNYCQETLYQAIRAIAKDISTPVDSLFRAVVIIKERKAHNGLETVYCHVNLPLREGATHVILSATANKYIYEQLFGERLRFIDLSGSQRKGKLMLHTRTGYSKTSIAMQMPRFVSAVKTDMHKYGFTGVITHKLAVEALTKAGINVYGHFGGLSGLDGFGGKDIAVYGTPHPPEYIYKIYACLFGWKYDIDDLQFQDRTIMRNEFEFSFPTCSALPHFQNLQLAMIEAELEQAVGRARLVNNNCTVHLFSNMPLAGGSL